jgi:hypothetical protein
VETIKNCEGLQVFWLLQVMIGKTKQNIEGKLKMKMLVEHHINHLNI